MCSRARFARSMKRRAAFISGWRTDFLRLSVSGTPAAIAWQVRASNLRLLQLEVPVTDKLFLAIALGARRWRVPVAPAVGGACDAARRLL